MYTDKVKDSRLRMTPEVQEWLNFTLPTSPHYPNISHLTNYSPSTISPTTPHLPSPISPSPHHLPSVMDCEKLYLQVAPMGRWWVQMPGPFLIRVRHCLPSHHLLNISSPHHLTHHLHLGHLADAFIHHLSIIYHLTINSSTISPSQHFTISSPSTI